MRCSAFWHLIARRTSDLGRPARCHSMAANSTIEWTDATWNPVRGCTRVSEGCRNCYAEVMAARFSKPGQWGHDFAEMRNGEPRWTGKLDLIESQLPLPLKWKKPRRIF